MSLISALAESAVLACDKLPSLHPAPDLPKAHLKNLPPLGLLLLRLLLGVHEPCMPAPVSALWSAACFCYIWQESGLELISKLHAAQVHGCSSNS